MRSPTSRPRRICRGHDALRVKRLGASSMRRTKPLRNESRWGFLYALPAIIAVTVFIGYPFLSIAAHAFTRWNGFDPPTWTGLRNFEFLLRDPKFRLAITNNVLFAISVPIQLVVPLVLAFLIHQHFPGWRFFRWTYFLPAVFSTVVVGIIARMVLQVDGPLNAALGLVGLGDFERDWLGSSQTAIPAIIVVLVWANFGYNVVLYLAGMSGIDPHLPE